MLDYAFRATSPGSRLWCEIAEAGERETLLAELERMASAFPAAAEARVAKGSMTRQEADRAHQVWLAIAADLRAEDAYLAAIGAGQVPPPLSGQLLELARTSGVHWGDKVEALRREIEARRRGNAAAVDKGRLTAADAQAQLERLEAVHYNYWQLGFAWESPSGAPYKSPTWWAEIREHDAKLAAAELGADVAEAVA